MKAVASMVTTGGILADIGTDHAYVPIALVQRQKIKGAIAMDINEGPLARAQEHIRAARLEEYIQTRLSDGAEALLPNEADSILIAGMGGELILHILTEGESVCSTAKELILQPQSEIHKVREYLRQHQYKIEDEDMVCEEGKYYPMMRELRVGIGCRALGVQVVDVYILQLARLAACAHGVDEALGCRCYGAQVDVVARLDDLDGLLRCREFDLGVHCVCKFLVLGL